MVVDLYLIPLASMTIQLKSHLHQAALLLPPYTLPHFDLRRAQDVGRVILRQAV
jgi:hypothetical protein